MNPKCEECGEGDGSNQIGDVLMCAECYGDHKCRQCWGSGKYEIFRNAAGELDYLHGRPTGQYAKCSQCDGEGYVE